MHAYLFVGKDPEILSKKAQDRAEQISKKALSHTIEKIADVRELNKTLRLSFSQPTCILINSLEKASIEAQNAFLKNLEEPGENISFVLTATDKKNVLPTIFSRCQTIRVSGNANYSKTKQKKANDFLNLSAGEMLAVTSKLSARDDAVTFMTDVLFAAHRKLVEGNAETNIAEKAQETINALKANGNVQLQLTNFVVNVSQ